MADKYVYVQNKHNAPIQANARGGDGAIVFTKKFMPLLTEKWSGKVIHNGYEKLTEEEYTQLKETSKTFKHFSEKLKLLVVHEDIPSDLKTPHEALVEARKEAKQTAAKIKALEDEITTLKVSLVDAENKYKEALSASGDAEKITALNDTLIAVKAYAQKLDEYDEVFVTKVTELAGKNEDVQKLVKQYREERKSILTVKK